MTNTHKRPVSTRKAATPPKSILIIDSEPAFVELLERYLGSEKGYRVLVASTGADGIKRALLNRPDLILVDFRLSDMSGLDVHETLKKNPKTTHIPVIYVSSFLTLRAIENASKKGARGFISKPFSFSEMHAKVANVLGSR